MQINEEKHILTDYNIDKMIESILRALEYNMYKQAVEGNIDFVKYRETFLGFGVDPRAAGRDFDEYMKFIDDERKEAENTFKFPIISEFRLTDKENPCKDCISSDCLYVFTFDKFLGGNVVHDTILDNAFVVDGILHNAIFEFRSVFGDINMLREGIRHEIKHAYDELIKHNEKGSDGKLGSFKTDNDKERDKIYLAVAKTLGNIMTSSKRLNFNQRKQKMSMEIILRSLYLLYEPEIHANYSEYYQEIKNNPDESFKNHEAYQKYYNAAFQIEHGGKTEGESDENGYVDAVWADPFEDAQCFDNVKKIAGKLLRYQRNFTSGKELKHEILKRMDKVLAEMKKIYNVFVGERKSTEDSFKESYNGYFNDVLNSLQESEGEVNGLYKFTMRRCYGKEEFERKIDKIRELFK